MKRFLSLLFVLVLCSGLPAQKARSLFSHTHVKYALQLAPAADSLAQKWLLSFEIHRRLNPFMAISFELMPFYRNLDKLDATLLAGYAFVNAKLGYKPVDVFGFYGGFGAGARVAQSWVDVEGVTFSRLAIDWAWHAFGGLKLQYKAVALLLEFHRLVESLEGLNEPNVRNYLMIGFGF